MTEPFGVRLRFHGDLDFFLKTGTNAEEVRRQLKEPTSVKNLIERFSRISDAAGFGRSTRSNVKIDCGDCCSTEMIPGTRRRVCLATR